MSQDGVLFDAHALDAVVRRTLAESPDLPVGARGAFVTVAGEHGVKAAIAVKVHDQWEMRAYVERPWHADEATSYGVTITGTW